MNKIIKRELEKVREVNLNYDDNTTKLYIPKKVGIKLNVGNCYIIKLSDYMVNPPLDSPIVVNWNSGNIPKYKYYKIDVNKIMGNMVNVNGVAYDFENKKDIYEMWSGWIPSSEFEILESI